MFDLQKQALILQPEQPIEVQDEEDVFRNDLLDHKQFVQRLFPIIKGVQPPFTVGIYGSWGTGKTSILRMLRATLRKENYLTCWFDAWKYEGQGSLLFPLFKQIQSDCQPTTETINKIKKIAVVTGLSVIDEVLAALKLPTTSNIANTFESYEKNYQTRMESWVDEVSNFQGRFADLVRELVTDKEAEALVIFIDDLDRCLPDATIGLLESIKNFLHVPKCIFVLAADEDVIARGVTRKYGSELVDGHSYLEKIVTLPFAVPSASAENLKKYIISLLRTSVKEVTPTLDNAFTTCADILGRIKLVNPRRVRRVAYRFLLYLTLDEAEQSLHEDIVKLLSLAEFYPNLYYIYRGRRGGVGLLSRLGQLFDGPLPDSERRDFEREFRDATGSDPEAFLARREIAGMLNLSNNCRNQTQSYTKLVDFLTQLQK